MAFRTVHGNMFASQAKSGVVVIEFSYGFPAVVSVTIQAILRQLSLMFILVAAQAILCQSQERCVDINFRIELARIMDDVLGLMAVSALNCAGMLALQLKTCQIVIEVLHSAPPKNKLELSAIVFAVALKADFVLFGFRKKVVPLFLVESLLNFLMTSEAFFCVGPAAEGVALRAVSHTLQFCVCLGQFAR